MARSGVAAAAAIAVVALAFGLRLAEATTLGISADVMVPTLIAAACLSLSGLARRNAPTAAGFSLGGDVASISPTCDGLPGSR